MLFRESRGSKLLTLNCLTKGMLLSKKTKIFGEKMSKLHDHESIDKEATTKSPSYPENVMAVIFLGIISLLYIIIFRGGWLSPTYILSIPLTILRYKKHPALRNPIFLLGIILLIMFAIQFIVNYILSLIGLAGLFSPFILIAVLVTYYLSLSTDSYSSKVGSVLFYCIVSIFYNIIHGPAWFLPALILTVPITHLFVNDTVFLKKLPYTFQIILGDRLRVSGIILLIMSIFQFGFRFIYYLNGAILPLLSTVVFIVTVIYFLHPTAFNEHWRKI